MTVRHDDPGDEHVDLEELGAVALNLATPGQVRFWLGLVRTSTAYRRRLADDEPVEQLTVEAIVRSACSGAWAECPAWADVDGRRVPAPNGWRPRPPT